MTFERCIMHDLDAIVHIDLMIYCTIREEVTSNTTPLITHIKYDHRYIEGRARKGLVHITGGATARCQTSDQLFQHISILERSTYYIPLHPVGFKT